MLRRLTAILIVAALALTGCSAGGSSNSPTATRSAAGPTASADPTPAVLPALTLGVDGLVVTSGSDAQTFAFDDPEPLLAFVEETTGVLRAGEDFDDPWGNGDVWGTLYTWDDITVSVLKDGPASVTVLAATIGGMPVQTSGGIAVGDTRDAVLTAGGWDEWDADGDGDADYLGVDGQDVAGTESLTRPGAVGRVFVSVGLDGDIVSQLQSPGNDFSDL